MTKTILITEAGSGVAKDTAFILASIRLIPNKI
jgi:hypothetical protein